MSMARTAAIQEGLDPQIFQSLVAHESGWNPDALSPVGASGLTQLMPATAQGLGVTSINDPVQNLRGGARYLKQNLDAFGGNYNLALAAYNAGPAAVRKYGGIPPYAETQKYVQGIMGDAKNYQVQGGASVPQSAQTLGAPPPDPSGVPPGMKGQALLPTLPRLPGGGVGDVVKAMKGMGGGINAAILSSLDSIPMPNINTSVQALNKFLSPEGKAIQNQRENFSFKFSSPEAVSPEAAHAVALCKEYLGTPYVWGGESTKGFDCSGLLQYVWAKQGVSIPRTTYQQWDTGTRVPQDKLQPGDAVFFRGSDARVEGGRTLPGHVGIYIGNGNIIQAPHTGATVEITPLNHMPGYMGARRFA
jgi:hypothetical protein